MFTNERKEKLRKNALKLSQMDSFQLLLVKTFQDGVVAGQQAERERQNKETELQEV